MLFTNTLAQSSRFITGAILSFVLAPVMLSRLGLEDFGIWAITGAMATYVGLLDLGIGRSLSRFVALFAAQGNERKVRESLGLGLLAATGVGVVVTLLAIATAPIVADLLDVEDTDLMRTVLVCTAVIFSMQAYGSVFDAVPIGMLRMIPPNVAGVVKNFINFGFSLGALLIEPTLEAYAIANAIAEVLGLGTAIVGYLYVKRGFHVALVSWNTAKEILLYGIKQQTGWMAQLVNFETDKVIIAVLVDVRAAGAFEVAARVVLGIHSLGVLTVSAIIPTVAALVVERGRDIIPWFYRHYLRRSVGLAFPCFVIGCATAPLLLVAWLGEAPEDSVPVLVVLGFAYMANITTGVGTTTALGDGRAGMVANNQVLSAVLNLILTATLAPLFGIWGVLAGTFTALVSANLIFIWRFQRVYEIERSAFPRAIGPPLLLSLGLSLPIVAAVLAFPGLYDDRWTAAAALVVAGGLYFAAYWVAASRLDFLPDKLTLRRRGAPEPAAVTSSPDG